MKIFDYLFYRAYKHFDKPNGQPSFDASIFVSAQVLCLASPIWLNFLYLFFNHPSWFIRMCVYLSIFLAVRIYYYRNKEVVLNRYNNSKYNRLIPTWAIFCITYLTFAIGAALGLYISWQFVEPNWPEGVLGEYILSFF